MNPRVVSCPNCQALLSRPEFYNTGHLMECPGCANPLRIDVFPAFFRESAPGAKPENVVVEGEASCFYHPRKKAVVPCESCGRFLCALCDVDLHGQHLCPVCLERGQQKRVLDKLENHRVRHDNLALLIALAPILAWPFTIVTAPVAVYYAIRHWNSPTSLLRPTRVRLILAILLGSAQIAGWVVGLTYAFTR